MHVCSISSDLFLDFLQFEIFSEKFSLESENMSFSSSFRMRQNVSSVLAFCTLCQNCAKEQHAYPDHERRTVATSGNRMVPRLFDLKGSGCIGLTLCFGVKVKYIYHICCEVNSSKLKCGCSQGLPFCLALLHKICTASMSDSFLEFIMEMHLNRPTSQLPNSTCNASS